jgi:hypothetical protein
MMLIAIPPYARMTYPLASSNPSKSKASYDAPIIPASNRRRKKDNDAPIMVQLPSSVGILVSGIKEVSKSFTSISFTQVKRHLNEATHFLAKSCFSVSSSEVFILFRIVSGELYVLMLFDQ